VQYFAHYMQFIWYICHIRHHTFAFIVSTAYDDTIYSVFYAATPYRRNCASDWEW